MAQRAFLGILTVFLIFSVTVTQACTSWTVFLNVTALRWASKNQDEESNLCAARIFAGTENVLE